MPLIEIPIHNGLMTKLRRKVAEFWTLVERNQAPEPDYAKDGAIIAEIYGADNGTTIDLSGDNRLPEIIEEDERLRREIGEARERRDAIKAEILHKLAGATYGALNGWRISNKVQIRKSYTVFAAEFAVLRTARTKERAYVSSGF